MNSRSSQPLVLEYSKRRFDGGPEIELIEHIENQYRIYEQQRLQAAWQQSQVMTAQAMNPHYYYTQLPQMGAHPAAYQAPAQPAQSAEQAPAPAMPQMPKLTIKQKLYKAFVMPYIEMLLGLSGVLIGSIMMVPLLKGACINPNVMKQERQALVRQSWQVVWSSLAGMVCAPMVAIKLLLQ